MPERIQLRRTKGWRMPNAVKVDRSSGFGNPFRISEAKPSDGNPIEKPWWVEAESLGIGPYLFATRDEAQKASVDLFRHCMTDLLKDKARLALRGKNLACWCKLGTPCHADVLLEIANQSDNH